MKRGFTLIELLVVISIIAIIGGIVVGIMGGHKQQAYLNQVQIGSHAGIVNSLNQQGQYVLGSMADGWQFYSNAGATTINDHLSDAMRSGNRITVKFSEKPGLQPMIVEVQQ